MFSNSKNLFSNFWEFKFEEKIFQNKNSIIELILKRKIFFTKFLDEIFRRQNKWICSSPNRK
ncbi:hypothetical protein E4413_17640 [Leptospira interrogans]|nr:hypothetical protein C5473_13310 [Leptospira interrogans serovar Weerasinghe]KAA1292358.1 hypothetical protein C4X99_11345 [Leptospira interrogans serovar Geyaweera]QCO39134.1 hypothetical protein E4412_17555 [Leptospira interrogans]QCO42901.1 hypothetical protein E4413_17640 [Leptospira interrogans]